METQQKEYFDDVEPSHSNASEENQEPEEGAAQQDPRDLG